LGVDFVELAIIGAGPYGLSLAAHMQDSGQSYRIFGDPMGFWTQHMPPGMRLKSEGFASDLYDPHTEFPLKAFCAENDIPYGDIGVPVKVETFVSYGQEFQRRYVPQLEALSVHSLARRNGGFELATATGETLRARKVVVATGIANFAYVPPELDGLPSTRLTHSSQYGDVSRFKGRRVAVLGAGASAIDVAAALNKAGAAVDLIARVDEIRFHDAPREPRPLIERIQAPRSGLGIGWRSRLCTDLPLVFRALPQALRFRAVARHLGPAPCWFTRDDIVGRVAMHLGVSVADAKMLDGSLCLSLREPNGATRVLEVDHLVAATGFRVAVSRLGFLAPALKSGLTLADDTPVLGRHFESSVPGLYFIGAAAANTFGPMLRFAFGANYAAKRVLRHLLKARA